MRAGDPGACPVAAPDGREEALLLEILLEHVEGFADEDDPGLRVGLRFEHLEDRRRIPQTRPSRRPARSRREPDPGSERRPQSAAPPTARHPGPPAPPGARRRGAQQVLVTGGRHRESQRFGKVTLVRRAVHAEQADAGRDRRLQVLRRGALQRRERLERSLVADLADGEDRIVLQRAVELGDVVSAGERVCGLVVAERLDDRAAKEILRPSSPDHSARLELWRRRRMRQARGSAAGRTNSDSSRGSASSSRGRIMRVDVVLEVSVGDGSQAIVGIVERLRHHVARARIVEPGEQDERAEADVAVRVAGDGLEQRGHRCLRRGAPDGPRRSRAGGVIDGRRACRSRAFSCSAVTAVSRCSAGAAAGRGGLGDRPGRQQGNGSATDDAV